MNSREIDIIAEEILPSTNAASQATAELQNCKRKEPLEKYLQLKICNDIF